MPHKPKKTPPPRIVFIGMNRGGGMCLEALLRRGYRPRLTITRPDYPVEHGNSVADIARRERLKLIKPENANAGEVLASVKRARPDLILVAYYNQRLGVELLSAPRTGSVNFHPSLLPRYRGATPVHWVVVRGERRTGVTAHFMEPSFDSGDIIMQRAIKIHPDETMGHLWVRLARTAAGMIVPVAEQFRAGRVRARRQDPRYATTFPKRRKEDARVDWSSASRDIRNLIRGMNPEPLAHSFAGGNEVRFFAARFTRRKKTGEEPGTILSVGRGRLLVQTGGPNPLLITKCGFADSKARLMQGMKFD